MRQDMAHGATLGVPNDHHTVLKNSEADDSSFSAVHPLVFDLGSQSRKVKWRVFEVQRAMD